MSVVGVLLAADAGTGFPTSKYLASFGERSMLAEAMESAVRWPVDDVLVVLGPDADDIESTVDLAGASVLVDPSWREGLASPLRAVLDYLSRAGSVTHAVVGHADQPRVEPGDVVRLVDAALRSGSDAVVPKYRYAVGFPVVLARSVWDVFLRLEGSIDVLDVVAAHAPVVEEVWLDHVEPRRIRESSDLPSWRR